MSRTLTVLGTALCSSALLALAGCASDQDLSDLDEPPATVELAIVQGQVRTIAGVPVDGATVRIGEITTITDAQGEFSVEAPGGRAQLVAEAPGFGSGRQRLELIAGETSQVTVSVLETTSLTLPDGALGGRLQGPDGVGLGFPEGSFTHADGTPVDGAVEVAYTLMNTPASIAAAPGGMIARIEAGEEALLESFGMVEVLLSQDGEPVTFTGNAEVEIPLSSTSEFDDGELIGLWSFDEDSGVWDLEGEGIVDGGVFKAEVSHFSFWNADQVAQTTCVKGRLVDPTGEGVGRVQVTHTGLDYTGSSSASVDQGGRFCTVVRRASNARIQASGTLQSGMPFTWSVDVQTPSQASRCNATCLELGDVIVQDASIDADGDGFTQWDGDCNDADAAIYPTALETCDGLDNNCNAKIDDVFVDADGDGFNICADCDDTRAAVYDNAPDVCDGILDNNCDGVSDTLEVDQDGDGLSRCAGDCNDADANSTEACVFTAVEMGPRSVCAVMSDGLAMCWGDDAGNRTAVPGVAFSSIAVGDTVACGLSPMGEATCWGSNDFGQLDAPTGAFASLTAGGDFVCGVRPSGVVECWGNDAAGRTAPLSGLFDDLDAASDHACAVFASGALRCWGAGQDGGTLYAQYSFDAVAVGDDHSCAITEVGQVVCWGNNASGQVTAPTAAFSQVAVGDDHSCGLTTAGYATCWGSDSHGQADAPRGVFTAIAAGGDASCGLRPSGIIECWGSNALGMIEAP